MPLQLKVITFLAVTVALIWLSRRSILGVRYHGLYRLLARESILLLVLLNLDRWFDDWLCVRQIVS